VTTPSIINIPFTPPSGTFVADKTKDIYAIREVPSGSINYTYNIGVPPQFPTYIITIWNNAVNSNIRIDITTPPYIFVDKPSSFILATTSSINVDLLFNEDYAKQQSLTTVRNYSGLVDFKITPLNTTSPIFVLINGLQNPITSSVPATGSISSGSISTIPTGSNVPHPTGSVPPSGGGGTVEPPSPVGGIPGTQIIPHTPG